MVNPPEAGQVRLSRRPGSRAFSIHYADGQSESFAIGKEYDMNLIFIRRKIPVDNAKRALDYAWNFGNAYVNAPDVILPSISKTGTRAVPREGNNLPPV